MYHRHKLLDVILRYMFRSFTTVINVHYWTMCRCGSTVISLVMCEFLPTIKGNGKIVPVLN
jgi:hypothetical protein